MADRGDKISKKSSQSSGLSKMVSKSKLKAFNISSNKKDPEDGKKRSEEEELADVYQEFVSSFQDTGKITKTWIKGGTVNPGAGQHEGKVSGSRVYKPTSKLAELAQSFSSYDDSKRKSTGSVSMESKRKTNLELFKEELKNIQEERQERRKLKEQIVEPRKTRFEPDTSPVALGGSLGLGPGDEYRGSMAFSDDVSTTNIYLGNINPNMTETQLMEEFGRYGPLASIKIMWPRSEEERARGRNCGFVAFMNRKDGERALNGLQAKDVMGFEMRLGWGKAVPIPPHPIYIPPKLAELTQPPPPSGLPFNAQPKRSASGHYNKAAVDNINRFKRSKDDIPVIQPIRPSNDPEDIKDFHNALKDSTVKVVIPTERPLVHLIHRMVEFVVREGPMFEAMIMNREIGNPQFRFLFDNHCPAHVYYRWKLFSILQGDSPYQWKSEAFRMFKGGSLWQPPAINPYTQGMPEHLIDNHSERKEDKPEVKEKETREPDQRKGQLSESQRDRFEDMLRELTPDRTCISDTMVWCLEHADSAEEIVECITESLSILQTPLPKKLARLYLVSDILFNSSAKVPHASYFRRYFEVKLVDLFNDVYEYYNHIESRLKAEQFKQRIMGCFRAWEDWNIYANEFLIKLQNIFLGLVNLEVEPEAIDLDGEPVDEVLEQPIKEEEEEQEPDEKVKEAAGKFVTSKWETVDEATLATQAVTTSKWDMFEQYNDQNDEDLDGKPIDDDLDGEPLEEQQPYSHVEERETLENERFNEERRNKLREIELKVIKYHDELEAGKRTRKPDISISEQVEQYRKKLLSKEGSEREKERRRRSPETSLSLIQKYDSPSPSPSRSSETRRSRRSGSRSPRRKRSSRNPSASPPRKSKRSRSRSPSRHRHKKHKRRD